MTVKLKLGGLYEARNFFSAKVFLATLVGFTVFFWFATGGDRQAAREFGLLAMAPATALVTMLAVFAIMAKDWRPDPRPFKDRPYVSGQSWVSVALAMIPITIFLLLQ